MCVVVVVGVFLRLKGELLGQRWLEGEHLGWWDMPVDLVPVVFPLLPAFSETRSRLPGVVAATLEVRDARRVTPSIDQGPLSRLGSRGRSVTVYNRYFVRKVPTPEGRGVIVCKIAVEKRITLSNLFYKPHSFFTSH